MAVNSRKYLMHLMYEISAFDLEDGGLLFTIDDPQEASWANEQETIWATGLNGVRLGGADRNKASRISATSGSVVEGLMAAQVGGEVKTAATTISKFMDVQTISDSGGAKVTLRYKPQGEVGAEVDYVYKVNADGTIDTAVKYTQDATASATKFSFVPLTGVLTLPTGVFTVGDRVAVQYKIKASSAKTLSNDSGAFSKNCYLVAKAWAQDVCTKKDYVANIIFYNAKISGAFEMAFGNEFAVHAFEAEAVQSCGEKRLWDFIVYDEEDVETVA